MRDARCAMRAPPVLLRFSAAHKARQWPTAPPASRPFARALAVTVAVFVSKGPVFVPRTTDVA